MPYSMGCLTGRQPFSDFWDQQLQTSLGIISIVSMKSPFYLLVLLTLTLVSCETPPPNILFIMADDHSSQAFGLYGNELDAWVQADQIQRLASEGMRLDRVYCTNSICVPSRAAILTGQYSHRNGVYTLNDALPTDVEHVGHLMQKGRLPNGAGRQMAPQKGTQGFDYYNVLPGQGLYQNPLLKEKGQEWQDANKGGKQYQGFSTDVITDQALGWLQARDPDKPFMLMCHFKAVHEPFGFAERFQELYQNDTLPLPTSLFEDRSHRSAGSRDKGIFMQDLLWRYTNWTKRYPYPPLDTTDMSEEEAIRAVCQKLRKDYLRGVAGINETWDASWTIWTETTWPRIPWWSTLRTRATFWASMATWTNAGCWKNRHACLLWCVIPRKSNQAVTTRT